MIIIYFFVLLIVFLLIRQKGHSPASLLVFLYLISTFLSLIGWAFYSDYLLKTTFFALLYYYMCMTICLLPFMLKAKYNFQHYKFPEQLIKILSIILIVGGIVCIYYTAEILIKILSDLSYLRDLRGLYYQGNFDYWEGTIKDGRMSRIVLFGNLTTFIMYLSSYFCFFYLSKKKYLLSVLLFIASLSIPLQGIIIGERQASLIWLSNYILAFIIFRTAFNKKTIKKLFYICGLISIPIIIFFIAMSISRFSSRSGGTIFSIIRYGGEQPFNFSYFFENLENQKLLGRLNFGYLFPYDQRLTGQINEYILSSEYLNVFASIPGSLFLDFGYFTIFICLFFSIIAFMVLSIKKNKPLTFFQFYFMLLLYQIMFMGIFYNKFISYYDFWMNIFVVIIVFAYSLIIKYQKYIKRISIKINENGVVKE